MPVEVAVNLPGLSHTLYGLEMSRSAGKVTVRVYQSRDPRANAERTIVVDEECVLPWHSRPNHSGGKAWK